MAALMESDISDDMVCTRCEYCNRCNSNRWRTIYQMDYTYITSTPLGEMTRRRLRLSITGAGNGGSRRADKRRFPSPAGESCGHDLAHVRCAWERSGNSSRSLLM